MSSDSSSITDEMRALIGRPYGPFRLEVSHAVCRAFARAVGHTDPIYFDPGAARAAGRPRVPVSTHLPPPAPDALDGEGPCVVVSPDAHPALVLLQV